MFARWTFGQRLGAGFAIAVTLTALLALVATRALREVAATEEHVIEHGLRLVTDGGELEAAMERRSSSLRGFLLTGDARFSREIAQAQTRFDAAFTRLREAISEREGRALLERVAIADRDMQAAIATVVALRARERDLAVIARGFEEHAVPARDRLAHEIHELVAHEQRELVAIQSHAKAEVREAVSTVVSIGVGAALFAAAVAFFLSRALGREIEDAVRRVQSSSAELQASASQQAAGAKEQSTAMSEVATTISELLATSRQIAHSAQSVAEIAAQTATSSASGTSSVSSARDSVAAARSQVERIVSHMLDLGQKSQRIGAVLDIVTELAEQTNILAINATIESVGAGEAGRRFTTVADEIRKLADRVRGATQEIRALIEEVRSAVHTTIMMTETGSKAVEANARQFSEVATAFEQITSLITTASEAASEIQLSTQQQSSAVEQVNQAITSVAEASLESESSTQQTLQTASELALLSRGLQRLVQREAAA